MAPYSQTLLKIFRNKNNDFSNNPVIRALKFIYLSNYSFLGKGRTLILGDDSSKQTTVDNLKAFLKSDFIKNTQFTNLCFRKFLSSIIIRDISTSFLYSDPPYFETDNNYNNDFSSLKWKEEDVIDLFRINIESGIKFAISEFDHPFIISLVKKYNLNLIPICERQNLKNRRNEILITNYNIESSQLDLFFQVMPEEGIKPAELKR